MTDAQQSNRLPTGEFFAWDSTMLKAALKCPTYFRYKIVEGWQPFRKSVHLIFGGHYAKALERFHRMRAEGTTYDDALIEVVWLALKETWEVVGTKDGEPIGKPWDSMDNLKTRETLIRSIVWYLDQFENDPFETVVIDGKAAAELSFTLAVDNGIVLCGHLDRVARNGEDYYITDNKTTGSTITPKFFNGFDLDTQMSLYTFVGKAIFDLPVKGVVIDGAQIAVGFTRFERGFTHRTEDQLDEWYDDAMAYIAQINGMVLADYYPKNTESCDKYGGCEFRHVCGRSRSSREAFLKADFSKQKLWNPLCRR